MNTARGCAALTLCLELAISFAPAQAHDPCPYSSVRVLNGAISDGCTGADHEPPQLPKLLDRYGKHRPSFNVAGVDYHAGVPAALPLRDPATASLPSGCEYSNRRVTCSRNDVIVDGFDFARQETSLAIPDTVSGAVITNNKFALGLSCTDPLLDIRGGSVTISHNSFDGAGAQCPNLLFGTLIFLVLKAQASSVFEYNVFENIPSDALQFKGPALGSASIRLRYNLFRIQGFYGHPDGVQTNGGNFDPIEISFNTYYNAVPPSMIGAQPFHVEAQLTAALNHSTVSFNTIVVLGNCGAGHGACAANTAIACKQSPGPNANELFSAFGNYIDSSGAIAPLNGNGGCTGAKWGTPFPNVDLTTGMKLSAAPSRP